MRVATECCQRQSIPLQRKAAPGVMRVCHPGNGAHSVTDDRQHSTNDPFLDPGAFADTYPVLVMGTILDE